jgi:Family of unknown function (DUF6152)
MIRGFYVKARLLLALLAAFGATSAHAHHSFAMFDSDHQIRLVGKVAEYTWQNPHVYIELEAKDPRDPKGKTQHWSIECANPGILNRAGWKFNMIKKGDEITLVAAPLRTREPGALLKQIKLPDGRIFGNGGPAGPASISIEDGKPLAGAKP